MPSSAFATAYIRTAAVRLRSRRASARRSAADRSPRIASPAAAIRSSRTRSDPHGITSPRTAETHLRVSVEARRYYAIPDAQLSRLRGGCFEVGDACKGGILRDCL